MTAIFLFLLFIVASAILIIEQNQRLKRKAKRYAKKTKAFHEKLQQLADPSHFFTDEEVHLLKKEYDPLLADINKLYNNKLISKNYLDELGLNDFIEKRRIINHIQMKNNQAFSSPLNGNPR